LPFNGFGFALRTIMMSMVSRNEDSEPIKNF